MKYGKIIGILLVICVAITFLGVASAAEIVVNGEKFNLPDDFKKDNESSTVTKTSTGTDENIIYGNGFDFVTFAISSFNSGSSPALPTGGNYTDKTINGIDGKYTVDEYGNEEFVYINNNKLIMISLTADSSLSFENIIIKPAASEQGSGSPFNLFG
ncbi:MAG: hypothetical protein IJF83_14650 [Methanobrevibacter sp.]|nr:hypothetical protein [Methanobrevibacter sp.]MBQ2654790.1 hypothetical protein [Methanobrevibacter sp.]